MTRSLISLALGCAVAASGCSDKDRTARTGQAGPSPVEVTLLDAGKQPRRALRYQPGRARRQFELGYEIAMPEARAKGKDEETRFALTVDWRAADAEAGRARREWTVTDTRAVALPASAAAGEASIIRSIAEAYRGATGHVVADSAGRGTFTRGEGQPVRPGVESLLEQAVVPLPAEPIGVGATWRSARSQTIDGAIATYTYELVALDARRARVRVAGLEAATPAGDADDAAEPIGMAVKLEGEAEIDFSDLLPRSGRWSTSLVSGGAVSPDRADGGAFGTEDSSLTAFIVTIDGGN
jgi:hypothetical protein